jgi:hypothetical protein
MNTSTPFLPHLSGWLFGRPPRSVKAGLEAESQRIRKASLGRLYGLFGKYIPKKLLDPADSGLGSRQRMFSTRTTFWAFLAQVLSPDGSCREALRRLQAWQAAEGLPVADSSTSGYCQARKRLKTQRLRKIHDGVAGALMRKSIDPLTEFGRRVRVVDGTGVSMPDTAANQKIWPQPKGQKPGCGFPFAKLVGLFSLANGVLIDWVEGNKHDHEAKLFRRLWDRLVSGDLLLADRGYCSYAMIGALLQRGIDTVMRIQQARPTDFRKGTRLGPRDRLIHWIKPPKRLRSWTKNQWDALPEQLMLRMVQIQVDVPGFRVQSFVLVTTLTNPTQWPKEKLARLYFRRWSVELFLRDIKITMGMDILRCKTPAMVRKEIIVHVIAYNCIRALMQHAAALYHLPFERISFKGTADTLRQWADALLIHSHKPRKQSEMIAILFRLIAEDRVPYRPERAEPRVKKRRPKNYQRLTKPRHQMPHPVHRNRG